MDLNRIHYLSGLIMTVFIGFHLFNHFCSIFSAEKHIEVMNLLRHVYRNRLAESILLIVTFIQINSGIRIFNLKRKNTISGFDKLQIYTGLYLAIFLVIHVSAVVGGRIFLNLDTNYYFGVAGLNYFPVNLFFIPYYALAVIAFFGHIASIHSKKMKHTILGISPKNQSIVILIIGVITTIVIFYGLTNQFNGVIIPKEYEVLIGK